MKKDEMLYYIVKSNAIYPVENTLEEAENELNKIIKELKEKKIIGDSWGFYIIKGLVVKVKEQESE